VELYLIAFGVFLGGGLLVGFLFRWWGLFASVGFACFLAYAWQLDPVGITYAAIGCAVASAAVVAGALLRRKVNLLRIRL
jgi:hypothetical protein